jgi:glycosyltransferase involved in cell wall biosynthesis
LADSVIGNSNAGLRAYNAPRKKATCIHNGINENRFALVENVDYEVLKAELGVDTKYLVAMFARVDHYKDPDAFIALANKVLAERDDVTFLFVGKGLYYDKYKDVTGPKNRLRFIGFRSDVEPLMAMTDVSILFSNYKFHQEGVSNSIMESMAFGTPAIATDGGGSPEIIEHGVNGYLVKENSIKESSRILSHLLDNPSELERVSESARTTIQQRFLLGTMVANYLELYRKLLA